MSADPSADSVPRGPEAVAGQGEEAERMATPAATEQETAFERGFPYRSFPTGWYQVAWSPELAVGDVKPLRYFGVDLVCYRGESGEVHVLDAHCPHLGAHLGHGGRITGDDVVCPFHAWRWGPSGDLAGVPSGATVSDPVRIGCWQVEEVGSAVLVWYDALGRPPHWRFPGIPEEGDPRFYPAYPHGCFLEPVGFPPQFPVENAVDAAHIKYVHRWLDVPTLEPPTIDGVRFVNRIRGTVSTPHGPAEVEVVNDVWGLGLFSTRLVGLADTAALAAVTPIDERTSHFRVSLWVARPTDATGVVTDGADDEPCGVARAILKAQYKEVLGPNGDRPIFEGQRYVARPPLTKEEARPFMTLRRWARQFYPDAPNDPALPVEQVEDPEEMAWRP